MKQKNSIKATSSIKKSKKTDYHKQLDAIIETIKDSKIKPTLLLHACCAPCSSYVIEYLAKYFDISIYYYNPNIHPETEYTRRLNELVDFLPKFSEAINNSVKLIKAPYDPEDYFKATNVKFEPELQTEEERGERCHRCYKLRLEKTQNYAKQNNFDWYTTTLSISPYKDAEKINTIGMELDNISLPCENTNTRPSSPKYLPADFKKNSGFLRSTQISKEYNLWRQDYCGCIYSKQNEEARRAAKSSGTH